MSAFTENSAYTGRVLGGRWVVGDALGSGSFGVVHAGVEQGTGQAIAVKLLHPQFLHHGEVVARFWTEAEALRRLNHPNVLVLLDVGMTDDGVPYLVTELLTGETLRDLLTREGPLPPERAMRLLGPAAHALHHAHAIGILHRDLKPENIFRLRKDGMGTTKILDFGMAKLLDTGPGRKLSQTGVMIGTMAYSAPEQMQGVSDLDHRADQFGFAALMFEALTGQRPFPHSQPFQLFTAVLSGPRPRASSIRPGLPKSLDDVLMRALDAERSNRYADVESFYLALTQALTVPDHQGGSQTVNLPPFIKLPEAPVGPAAPQGQPFKIPYEALEDEVTRGEHDYVGVGSYADPGNVGREQQFGPSQIPPSHPLSGTLHEGSVPPPVGSSTLVSGPALAAPESAPARLPTSTLMSIDRTAKSEPQKPVTYEAAGPAPSIPVVPAIAPKHDAMLPPDGKVRVSRWWIVAVTLLVLAVAGLLLWKFRLKI